MVFGYLTVFGNTAHLSASSEASRLDRSVSHALWEATLVRASAARADAASDLLAAASAAETSAARSTCSKNDVNISLIDHTSSHGNR